MEIFNWKTGELLYRSEHLTMTETLKQALTDGVSLAYANLSHQQLGNANTIDGSGEIVAGRLVNLMGIDLANANLSSSAWSNVQLDLTNLSKADLSGCKLIGSVLPLANLNGANLTKLYAERCDFTHAHVENTVFHNAAFTGCVFDGVIFGPLPKNYRSVNRIAGDIQETLIKREEEKAKSILSVDAAIHIASFLDPRGLDNATFTFCRFLDSDLTTINSENAKFVNCDFGTDEALEDDGKPNLASEECKDQ